MTALQSTIQSEGGIARAGFRVESHCRRCAATLEQALRTTDGVRFALVLPVSGVTIVDYEPTLMTLRDLQEAIEAAGFPAESHSLRSWTSWTDLRCGDARRFVERGRSDDNGNARFHKDREA